MNLTIEIHWLYIRVSFIYLIFTFGSLEGTGEDGNDSLSLKLKLVIL
jgi:hypothetical protein